VQNKEVILIVEDNTLNIDLLVHTLSPDYQIRVTTDGRSTLQGIEKINPDLILLDVMLPDIDGFEICRKLKLQAATRDIPIIFLTALTDKTDEAIGLAAGASDFIAKPFNADLLKARVRIHLELKAHRDRLDKLVAERTSELEKTKEAVIASLAILSEYRDYETGRHIQRTRAYVRCLAQAAWQQTGSGYSGAVIDLISQSAQLHDIGKVGIPDAILLKPGRLSDEEFENIKRHTLIGAEVIRRTEEILGTNTFLRFAREIAECHHERWDGSGYPQGLLSDEIPVSAQLMSIVDVYDALTSVRPYKVAFSHDEAVRIILEGDDRTRPEHFSPVLLNAFRKCQVEFQRISEILVDHMVD
jgi:putative two-component system response regulator